MMFTIRFAENGAKKKGILQEKVPQNTLWQH